MRVQVSNDAVIVKEGVVDIEQEDDFCSSGIFPGHSQGCNQGSQVRKEFVQGGHNLGWDLVPAVEWEPRH